MFLQEKHLAQTTVERADTLKVILPAGMGLPEMALRFILSHPAVSTIIPGMRKLPHVEANMGASDAGPLADSLIERLRQHRWDRRSTKWSQ